MITVGRCNRIDGFAMVKKDFKIPKSRAFCEFESILASFLSARREFI